MQHAHARISVADYLASELRSPVKHEYGAKSVWPI